MRVIVDYRKYGYMPAAGEVVADAGFNHLEIRLTQSVYTLKGVVYVPIGTIWKVRKEFLHIPIKLK